MPLFGVLGFVVAEDPQPAGNAPARTLAGVLRTAGKATTPSGLHWET